MTADEIKDILRRENDLRLSHETQQEFQAASKPDDWIQVVERLQRRVCLEFGLSEQVGLNAMRRAESLLPGDQDVNEISLYRKYNRCRDGTLQVSDTPPNLNLWHFDSQQSVCLQDVLLSTPKWTVVFAGSYT